MFVLSGGNNEILGNSGSDQFWIANGQFPDALNTITDFTSGEDVIGVAGLSIGFGDLAITEDERGTLISANNSELAILTGVSAEVVADEANFAFA